MILLSRAHAFLVPDNVHIPKHKLPQGTDSTKSKPPHYRYMNSKWSIHYKKVVVVGSLVTWACSALCGE